MKKENIKFFDYFRLRRKYNTLKLKYDVLLESVKDNAFNKLLSLVENSNEIERIKKENKNLRLKNKALKELLREETNGKNKSKKKGNKSIKGNEK